MIIKQIDLADDGFTTLTQAYWEDVVKNYLLSEMVVFRVLCHPNSAQYFNMWCDGAIERRENEIDNVFSLMYYYSEFGVKTEIIPVGFLEETQFVLFAKPRYETKQP